MSTPSPVAPNPSILAWARMESGYDRERVAKRLNVKPEKLAGWESGVTIPTFRQLENLAKFYHRPLGIFFRPKPPLLAPLSAEYRRLPNVIPGSESPEFRLALRQLQNRREILIQLTEELGEPMPVFDLSAHLSEKPEIVAKRLRDRLNVSIDSQLNWESEWVAWSTWRSAAEDSGIAVFQFPGISIEEARGVSLLNWPLPVAAINPKEISPESRSFTLMHEIVHIMLAAGHDERPAADEPRNQDEWYDVERYAEETASHVLVPETALSSIIQQVSAGTQEWNVRRIRWLAKQFRITPMAMATRLRSSGYIDWDTYRNWRNEWDQYVSGLRPRGKGFATPVTKTLGRAGRPFTRLVLEALNANKITSVQASRFLNLKYEHFDNLKIALRSITDAGGDDE